jgi:hypothetical protein
VCALLNFNDGKEPTTLVLRPLFYSRALKAHHDHQNRKSMVGVKAHFTVEVHFVPLPGVFPFFI